MPAPDPNYRIEEIIQTYSRKRRERMGPGVELHPAPRKVLLQQVRETFPSAQPEEAPAPVPKPVNWWGWIAAAAVIVWAAILYQQVEMPEPQPAIQPMAPIVIAPPKFASPVEPARSLPAVQQMAALRPASAPAAAPAQSQNASLAENRRFASDSAAGNVQSAAPLAPAGQAVSKATGPVRRTLYVRSLQETRYRENVQAPPLPKVLTAFEVARTDSTVRIKDADGSVFEGNVLGGATEQNAGNYSFQVSGVSSSLGQSVVFTGQVVVDTNQQNSGFSSCSGVVQVGTKTEFPLQAVASP